MPGLRIAIIGAGPAGLALARLLQISNVPCQIFEGEASSLSRDQGGTVDLHRRGGQMVLEKAGLFEEFKKLSRPEGQFDKLVKYDGTLVLDEKAEMPERPDDDDDRPEIDRKELRKMLLRSLHPDSVSWGKRVVKVEPSPKQPGTYDLHFRDGVEEGFNAVIGADGAWSKVRPLLTDEKPFYSGITGIELWALEVDQKEPWLSGYVPDGTLFMFDEGRAIICQRNGSNSIRTYACVRQPENWYETCGIDWSQPSVARQQLIKQHFSDCGDDLKRCILDSKDVLVHRPMYMLPVSMKWENHPGLTLIGDSAHLMTPFAGVGVNLALVDAFELSETIIGSAGDKAKLDSEMITFEAKMFKRSQSFAQKTWDGLEQHFRATGCDERAEKFRARVAAFLKSQQAK
jgi:2-polyprenyl-6-methoxyphenol hydroxylase-like FAD-dependent oxidoreductase